MAATGTEDSELSALLARVVAEEEAARATPRRRRNADGRSKHATHQRCLREHVPLVYFGLYREPGDALAAAAEHQRRRDLEELARVRREALAYCVECRNPLVATPPSWASSSAPTTAPGSIQRSRPPCARGELP